MNGELEAFLAAHKTEALTAALVLARIGPLVLLAPAIGGSVVPLRFRFAMALCLAVLIVPLQLSVATGGAAPSLAAFPPSLISEALIGTSIALCLACVAAGMQLGGQLVSSMSGMSLAQIAGGEAGPAVPVIGRIIELVAVAVFVSVGGHRLVMDALLDTFRWAPAGEVPLRGDLIEATIAYAGRTFVVAIRVAAPIALALLLSITVVGLLSRALPQMHTWSIGLGLNAAVLLAMLSISLGGAAWVFRGEAQAAVEERVDRPRL